MPLCLLHWQVVSFLPLRHPGSPGYVYFTTILKKQQQQHGFWSEAASTLTGANYLPSASVSKLTKWGGKQYLLLGSESPRVLIHRKHWQLSCYFIGSAQRWVRAQYLHRLQSLSCLFSYREVQETEEESQERELFPWPLFWKDIFLSYCASTWGRGY